MRIVILDNASSVHQRAADIFCDLLHAAPNAVLGLATGGTPIDLYNELVDRYEEGLVSFAECTTFNLDEYLDLPFDHPESYRTFMQRHLFSRADFDPDFCHLPDGQSDDPLEACHRYEKKIDDAGGIDLQLLGIGSDGHIAFNEPGSSLASRTRIKALTEQTRQDNARFFDSFDDVPTLAITMGIGTILEADRILLLATGAGKAEAVEAFVEGPLSAQVPASALQMHPNVTVLLDPDAASRLKKRAYYDYVESLQVQLESRVSTRHQID